MAQHQLFKYSKRCAENYGQGGSSRKLHTHNARNDLHKRQEAPFPNGNRRLLCVDENTDLLHIVDHLHDLLAKLVGFLHAVSFAVDADYRFSI